MTPLLCTSLTFAFILITVTPAHGAGNVVIQWNSSALEAVRQSKMGPPMVARALAIAHTCMYDAWAAYDDEAIGTQLAATLRRPEAERNEANRSKAISYAAYLALSDLFPAQKSVLLDAQMISLGFDPADHSTNPATPSGIGNLACAAVLSIRHNDGSNQLGNLTASGVPYADYTGYVPVNPPSTVPVNPATVADVNSWQPLQYFDATGKFVTQRFLAAQWLNVTPFALSSGSEFRDTLAKMGPARFGSPAFLREAEEVIDLSAHLTDRQKMVAEYWKDGPNSETPPGHWCLFAQFVSTRDNHSLSDDVKMFFAMTNATFDSSIVAWDAKRAFDSVRPATAIPFLFQGKSIQAWGGPLKGTITMDGSQWIPYQPATFPTPPFPEFISGHSTFSAAAATVLRAFTGSDDFDASVTFLAGTSGMEPGSVPGHSVTLHWDTFSAAANQAGFSRRLGGIHFRAGDIAGRHVGHRIGAKAFAKAQSYWQPEHDR